MPVIKFGYEDLCSLVGENVPVGELIDKIPLMGADIANVSGDNFEVEFFPNRPDLYSVEGVARALRTFLGKERGLRKYEVRESDIILRVDKSVQDVRPYVVCGLVKGVEMSDELIASMMELQEKLHLTLGRGRRKVAIGVHDFENVTPPFTYKAVEPKSVKFVPLGESTPMNLDEILEKHEKGRDYAHTVQGKSRYPLFVDSEDNVLSFPPIINGIRTQLTPYTKDIFLDLTGTDLNALKVAIAIVASALAERGGELYWCKTVYEDMEFQTPDLAPSERTLDAKYVNDLLGLKLSLEEMAGLLERMGFGAAPDGEKLTVQVPAYRSDILHPVDLVEDVAVAYGYMNFDHQLPKALTFGKALTFERTRAGLRQLMMGVGYLEVQSLTLGSKQALYGKLRRDDPGTVELVNPISIDYDCLRTSMLPSLLEVLKANKHRELPQKIFEVGNVILQEKNARRLSALAIHAKAGFTEAKSLAEAVATEMGLEYEVVPREDGAFIGGRCAALRTKPSSANRRSKDAIIFGELAPEVITAFELSYPIIAIECDLEVMAKK